MDDRQGGASLPPLRFADLAAALLGNAKTLVPAWLQGGVVSGHEYVCGSLAGGKGRSCSVNLNTGAWSDFAGGEKGGDLLSLYAAINGLSMAKACVELAHAEGLESVAGVVTPAGGGAAPVQRAPRPEPAHSAAQQQQREQWRAIAPVPAYAPAVNFQHQHRVESDIAAVSEYWCEGALYGYVVRFKTSDGGKDDIARTFCESEAKGGARWHWKQWQEPRPLYLAGGTLPKGRTVVLVEGEIKAAVLQTLLEAHAAGVYCVVGWPGGCKAWHKADWSWVAGCTVICWPDCDSKRVRATVAERKALPEGDEAALRALKESKPYLPYQDQPGMKAMRSIGAHLRDVHGCTVSLIPVELPGVLPDGWDAKDAIQSDGWTADQVLAFFGRAVAFTGAADEAVAPKKNDGPVGTVSGGNAASDGLLGDEDQHGDDWEQQPQMCGGREVPRWLACYFDHEKVRWTVSRKTVIAALEKCPDLRGVVAYDELRNTVSRRRAFPWPGSKPGELQDADALLLGDWMSSEWGLPSVSAAALEEGIRTVANKNRFHPVREWIQTQQWDGKARLDNWLVYALGESPQSLNPRLLEYLRMVGRYWLLGMVNRVMQPGCKFDYMPVLEGLGGLRKSTLVEVLAGSEYYSDTQFEIGRGKDGQEQVQGVWLYEVAELANFSKSEVGAIKAFVSSKVDRYRVAYGKIAEAFPRQCLLVGTTNEDTYLRDRTGNRRFWPVPVRHRINTDWVQKYRHQLMAEAYAQYQQGAAYGPDPEIEARLFVPMQESRLVETAVDSELLTVLTRKPNPNASGPGGFVHCEASHVTIAQLVQALGVDAAKAPPGLQGQITAWLKHQGWTYHKKQIDGVRAGRYFRPANWPRNDEPLGLDHPEDDAFGEAGAQPSQAAETVTVAASAAAQFIAEDADFVPF